jgi:DNA-binding transcriptional ArsR family regulator
MSLVASSIDTELVFSALSHETRRHVLLLLNQRGGELPAGYLASKFAQSWPTTTRHLSVLEQAGLVKVRREGRTLLYSLDHARLFEVTGKWLSLMEPQTPLKKWRRTVHGNPEDLPRDAGSERPRRRGEVLRRAAGKSGKPPSRRAALLRLRRRGARHP